MKKNKNFWHRIVIIEIIALLVIIFLTLIIVLCTRDSSDNTQEDIEYSQDTSQKRKIISVVYDDSWSMSENNSAAWAYANYAFQIFDSVLNEGDRLFVTTTSNPEVTIELDQSADAQTIINTIQQMFDNGDTQLKSISNAYKKLGEINDNDENTEYWLFVFSDGQFYNGSPSNTVQKEDLAKVFYDCADDEMPNGTNVNIAYLGIGNEIADLGTSTESNVKFYYAKANEDIMSQMINVTSDIRDLSNISDTKYLETKFINDTTLKVTTDFQLSQLLIILQNSESTITDVYTEDENDISIERNVSIQRPMQMGYESDLKLYGSVASVSCEGSFFEKGVYYIVFSEEVDINNIALLMQPCLAVDVRLYSGDTSAEITDFTEIYESSNVYAKYTLFDTGTGEEIEPLNYFDNVDFSAVLYCSGNFILENESETMTFKNLPLEAGTTLVEASVKIDNFTPITGRLVFETKEDSEYEIVFTNTEVNNVTSNSIVGGNFTFSFYVYKDEKLMTRSELLSKQILISASNIYSRVKFAYRINADGKVTVTPYYITNSNILGHAFKMMSLLLPDGNMKVTCTIRSDKTDDYYSAIKVIKVTALGRTHLIIYIIELIILFFIIFGYLFKPRFQRESNFYMSEIIADDNRYFTEKSSWRYRNLAVTKKFLPRHTSIWSFIPFVANRIRLGNVVVVAKGYSFTASSKRRLKIKIKRGFKSEVFISDANEISSQHSISVKKESLNLSKYKAGKKRMVLRYNQGLIICKGNNKQIYKSKLTIHRD